MTDSEETMRKMYGRLLNVKKTNLGTIFLRFGKRIDERADKSSRQVLREGTDTHTHIHAHTHCTLLYIYGLMFKLCLITFIQLSFTLTYF